MPHGCHSETEKKQGVREYWSRVKGIGRHCKGMVDLSPFTLYQFKELIKTVLYTMIMTHLGMHSPAVFRLPSPPST